MVFNAGTSLLPLYLPDERKAIPCLPQVVLRKIAHPFPQPAEMLQNTGFLCQLYKLMLRGKLLQSIHRHPGKSPNGNNEPSLFHLTISLFFAQKGADEKKNGALRF